MLKVIRYSRNVHLVLKCFKRNARLKKSDYSQLSQDTCRYIHRVPQACSQHCHLQQHLSWSPWNANKASCFPSLTVLTHPDQHLRHTAPTSHSPAHLALTQTHLTLTPPPPRHISLSPPDTSHSHSQTHLHSSLSLRHISLPDTSHSHRHLTRETAVPPLTSSSSPSPSVPVGSFFTSSLYMNTATPTTISSTNRYFLSGWRRRLSSTPISITGIGLHDFPTTWKTGREWRGQG